MSEAALSTPAKPRVPSTERAYAELRRRIVENEMPAGSVILEQHLATLLGMSRTPVREAMIRLANEGLVEVRPRHGFRILPIEAKDMVEIYAILTALEAAAAETLARDGVAAEDLAALEAAVASMDAALEADDLDAWAASDERFHKLLVSLTGNRRLLGIVDMFWDQAHRVRMVTLRLREKPIGSNRDHRAVVEAIRRGDPETARARHASHRLAAGRVLVELLEKYRLRQI